MKLVSESYLESKPDGSLELIITPGPQAASSWYCFTLGSLAFVFAVLTQALVPFLVGILFTGSGFLLVRNVYRRKITMPSGGVITVVTERVFGNKKLVQTITRQDIERVDYAEGFNNKTVFGNVYRYSSLYFTLKNGENIAVMHRRGVKYIQPLYIPSFIRDVPLSEEAGVVARRLGVPLNTMPFTKITDIKNIFTPNDRTLILAGRPTQEELDKERLAKEQDPTNIK